MSRRTLLALAGWLAAAAVAAAIGVGAVRHIGSGMTVGGDALSPRPVKELLGIPAPAGTSTASSDFSDPSGPPGPSRSLSGPGGTVVAVCLDRRAFLVNWTPAPGFGVDRVERGPDDLAGVRFEGPKGRSEVWVRCAGGEPTAEWTD